MSRTYAIKYGEYRVTNFGGWSIAVLGDRIKQKREKLGLTQGDLGELIGKNNKQIYQYESGMNQPSADALRDLAVALGTTTDYLLDLTDIEDRPMRKVSDLLPDEVELLMEYRTKKPEAKKKILDVVKVL